MKKKRNGRIAALLVVTGLMLALAPDILCTATVFSGKDQTYALNSDGMLSITGEGDIDSFSDPAFVPWSQYHSVSALAADYLTRGNCGANLTYTLSSDGTLSITGEGDMDSFSDPASVPWSQYRSEITAVIFSGKITSIGTYAFEYCVNLENISIPDSVTEIGAHAFYWCSSLTDIKIPGNVTEIGDYAFYDCSKLTSITLSDGLEKIGNYVFCGCTSLTDIVVPESVTSIGEGAFDNSGIDDSEIAYKRGSCGTDLTWALLGGHRLYVYGTGSMTDYSSVSSVPWHGNCEDITDVVITDGVTSIGDYAFEGCPSLKSVTLAESVTDIGKNAFAKCIGLTEIEIRENITKISDYAFYQSGLTKVSISSNETVSVGDYVFAGCTDLSDVSLTGGKIGAYMFSGCTALEQIDIPQEVTELGSYAFQNCKGISSIVLPDSVTEIQEGVFSGCSGLEKIQFSPNIETIGNNAFKNCVGFDSFVIPDSVTSIGSGAFSGCSHLERITLPFVGGSVEETQASAKTLFGYVFGTAKYDGGTAVKQYYSESGNVTCYLPDPLLNVEITGGEILYGAFDGCAGLEYITIPDEVTKIDSYVFRDCKGLENITVSNSVTDIGAYAFSGCTGLSSIKLPKNLQSIGSGAFKDCICLEGIELPGNLTAIESDTFNGCTKLQGIRISEKISSIGDYAFSGCIGIESIELPETVTGIGKGVFKDCTGLQGIVIPKGIADISEYMFFGCTALKDITISGDVSGIGNYAFSGCEVLEEIVIPETVTDIGDYAFSGCSLMKNIRIPKETVGIGSGAFKDCMGLEKIEVPDSVADIGGGAFSGCSNLNSITLPFIGGSAEATSASGSTLFGYIFGTAGYTDGTAVRQYYSSSGSSTYYIPDALTSVKVTGGKILYGSFYGCGYLVDISLPGDLPEIGASAFYNCAALKRISIPGTVTAIADKAFSGCVGLGNITLPDNMVSIGSYAFSGCAGLDSISLPENLTTIGSYAFQNCSSIRVIQVPESVVSINAAAFSGCSSLESITLPFAGDRDGQVSASANSLFGYIFGTSRYDGGVATKQYYSGSSTTYYIPDSLKTVSITGGAVLYGTFYNCSNLTEIELPEQLTEFGNYAFYNCTNLIKITLPECLTKIGDHTFENCAGLEEVTLSDGVEHIGSYAFKGCVGLKRFSVPEGVTSIESYTFSGCTRLKSITIPESVTSIGGNAFQNCSSVTGITVPDAVTAINTAAFSGCSSLESMTLPFVGVKAGQTSASNTALFGAVFGTASYTGSIQTKQSYSSSASATYYIPETLKKVVITGGPVLYGAFYNCSGLTDITLPENLAEVGNYAFYNCSGLRNITLPKNLTGIGNSAFQNCTGLQEFSVPKTVANIEKNTFSGCTGLKSIIIPDGITKIGGNAFQNCSSITNIIIPNSVTTIDSAAFSGCSSLESMTLPFVGSSCQTSASSKTLFGYIFGTASYEGGTLVQQYYSSNSVKNYIPASLKTVAVTGGPVLYGAFYNCSGLTDIILPDDLTSIGQSAFYNCSSLTGIIIPSGVTEISKNAFAKCTGIRSITFSGSAPETIDKTAFTDVTATVYYPISDDTWSIHIGNDYGGTLVWEAHTHSYRTVVIEPTCTEQGYTEYRCSTCNSHYKSDFVNALGHESVTDAGIRPTCTQTGLTEGAHCSVCKEVIYKQEIIPALGHRYTDYVSNQDATYDADGTMTAECDNGCGEKETIIDTGSMLTDSSKPEIEISLGNNRWTGIPDQITFDLLFKEAQTVTVTAKDEETLLDGKKVSRLDKVYYYIADSEIKQTQLESVSWTEYAGAIDLGPGKQYIVYAKAVDRSNNTAYASSQGIIVDDAAPTIAGISDGSVYCEKAVFTVTDTSLKSVTDNGVVILPVDGRYTIEGDDRKHTIAATDGLGHVVSATITINRGHKWGSYSYNNDAACETAGTKTAVCEYGCDAEDTQVDEAHPALGHDFGEPVFLWSDDYKSCIASYVCIRDNSHVETVNCTVKAESAGNSCTEAVETIYTATAIHDGIEKTDSKTVSGVVLGHDYRAEFIWSADKSSCVVTLTCQRETCSDDAEGHILRELACKVETKSVEATCILEGKKEVVASITVDGVEYTESGGVEVLPVDGTNHVNTRVTGAKPATATENGYTGDTYCEDCKKILAYGSVIPALGDTDVPGDTDIPGDTDVPGDTKIPGNTEIPDEKPTGTLDGKDENQSPDDTVIVHAKGSKIKGSNGETYTVTKAGSTGGKVSYTAPKNKKIKSAKIPADVKIDGITYKVTMIADSAFANCKKLTKVTIGSNITAIGKNAFKNCSKLKKVTVKSKKLKTVGKKAFKGIKTTAKVKVPAKKLKAFKKLLKKTGLSSKAKITK